MARKFYETHFNLHNEAREALKTVATSEINKFPTDCNCETFMLWENK